MQYHLLMGFHFYIITRYQSFFAFELSTEPIDVVFHVDHLKNIRIVQAKVRYGCIDDHSAIQHNHNNNNNNNDDRHHSPWVSCLSWSLVRRAPWLWSRAWRWLPSSSGGRLSVQNNINCRARVGVGSVVGLKRRGIVDEKRSTYDANTPRDTTGYQKRAILLLSRRIVCRRASGGGGGGGRAGRRPECETGSRTTSVAGAR